MIVRCQDCGCEKEFNLNDWRCACGGAWEPVRLRDFIQSDIQFDDYSIWRYGRMLGLDLEKPLVRMGVGWTPLVTTKLFQRKVFLKLEFLSPSGSFKDRGVNTMVNQLVFMGAKSVIEDSSGNAGASVAAHAARFRIGAEIYVPSYASQAKKHQIAIYGASVIPILGPRKAAEEAAQAAIAPGKAYASHVFNPAYLVGHVTAAYEVWEQLKGDVPDWILCPVAQGGQFLGYWLGFKKLLEAGLIKRLPHLVAVQAKQVAPIHQAWKRGMDYIPSIKTPGKTIAEGVAIPGPIRDKRILQALTETKGNTLAIDEDEILQAQDLAAKLGYYIEPTSALVFAGLKKILGWLSEGERVLLTLTGSGLKGAPQYR